MSGIALCCDTAGRLLDVVQDDMLLTVTLPKGSLWSGILDVYSQQKSFLFLNEIIMEGASFGWELNVNCGDPNACPWRFHGALWGGQVLVLGDAAFGAPIPNSTTTFPSIETILAELLRQNNSYLTAQRDLAQRIIELEVQLKNSAK